MSAVEVLLAILALATGCMLGAPTLLTRGRWRTRFPQTALALWLVAFLGGLLAYCASLLWAVTAGVDLQGEAPRRGPWLLTVVVIVAAWVGLASVGALVALVMARAEPLSAGHHDVCAQLDFLSLTSGYRRVSLRGVPVTFVASQVPAALSMSRRRAGILISSRLVDDLTPGELRAVLEHERTHVVRHHALIAQLARLNRACLPGFFGAKEFERATRLLVELIADDAAARVSGPQDVASALRVVADARGDESMSIRAQRISSRPTASRRWTRRAERRLPEWLAGTAD